MFYEGKSGEILHCSQRRSNRRGILHRKFLYVNWQNQTASKIENKSRSVIIDFNSLPENKKQTKKQKHSKEIYGEKYQFGFVQ